jgi:hypothetical protein
VPALAISAVASMGSRPKSCKSCRCRNRCLPLLRGVSLLRMANASPYRPFDKAQAANPSQRQRGAPAAATNEGRERSDSRRAAAPLPLDGPANGPIVALIDELAGTRGVNDVQCP